MKMALKALPITVRFVRSLIYQIIGFGDEIEDRSIPIADIEVAGFGQLHYPSISKVLYHRSDATAGSKVRGEQKILLL